MNYKLLSFLGIIVILSSFLVFAQEETEPTIGEVAVFTTDGRLCRGFVDSEGCAIVECNTGHSAKKCPVLPENICSVEIDKQNTGCINLVCGQDSSAQCIEETIEPQAEVIVPSEIGEVSIFSTVTGKSCRAWLAENSQGVKCAYAECYDGDKKLGETDVICPTDALPDYPEGLQAKPCIVSQDKEGNQCVKYSCSGFSSLGTRAYKNACLDQYVEPKQTEKKIVFLKNKTVVLNNITMMETIFQRIKLNATNLAEYYNSAGDTTNYQKYSSVANSASNILNSLNGFSIIIANNINDLENMSQEEQATILGIVNEIKNEFDNIKELFGGTP